ncbi:MULTISPECIES: hypothetical protein [unclassified Paenibacillus]|uniref:hypothetical protein n=1 Tax=unclassified Paenibacillus TaxID=185978 RepID=UPI00278127F8|nr:MULTISPECIES: hypothetical protein [unclassified Paenibacillus]MDQ0899403.1 hypothetical protein [Paenibacillus sp. V4I7]MDQ0914580.1 hypothetical protein [Paenibacillus sp. V4I5]
MNINEIRDLVKRRYPLWNIYLSQSGVAIWINMNDGYNSFILQVTPKDGVGISKWKESEGLDFSGHDESFNSLNEALDYMDSKISQK